MAEKPILMSGAMVRATLDGKKSQTRRICKRQPPSGARTGVSEDDDRPPRLGWIGLGIADYVEAPYAVGDTLWVREAFCIGYECGPGEYSALPPTNPATAEALKKAFYRADGEDPPDGPQRVWRPSIHMPRWASRLSLEATEVRAQRLQEISEADANAEGLTKLSKDQGRTWKFGIPDTDGLPGQDDTGWQWIHWSTSPVDSFARYWDSINGKKHPWASDPWVFAYTFKRLEKSDS